MYKLGTQYAKVKGCQFVVGVVHFSVALFWKDKPQTTGEKAVSQTATEDRCHITVQENDPIRMYTLLSTACGMRDLLLRARHPERCPNCRKLHEFPAELSAESHSLRRVAAVA